jgi:O-antigen ligase
VAAVHSPALVVIGVAGALLVVLMFTNLVVGVALFTLVTFFQQTPQGAGLALSKPIGLVLTIAWASALLQRRSDLAVLVRDRPVLAYMLAAFVAWAAISVVWAADAGETQTSVVRLALVAVLFLVVYSAVRTPRDLRILVSAFIGGTFLTTVYGLAFHLYTEGRFTGGLADANFFAAALVASLALCGFMLAAERRAAARLALVLLIGLFSAALIMTQSRGGLVALGVVLVASCLVAGRLRSRAIAVALVVVALGLGYYAVLAPAAVRERATAISAQASAGRVDTWRVAWQVTRHHPFAGVGLNNFPIVQGQYVTANVNLASVRVFREMRIAGHNTYLQILTELGIVGLGLLLCVMGLTVVAALRSLRQLDPRADPATDALVRGLVVAAVGLLSAYAFLTGQYEKHLWLMLGALAAVPSVVAHVSAGRPSAPDTADDAS